MMSRVQRKTPMLPFAGARGSQVQAYSTPDTSQILALVVRPGVNFHIDHDPGGVEVKPMTLQGRPGNSESVVSLCNHRLMSGILQDANAKPKPGNDAETYTCRA